MPGSTYNIAANSGRDVRKGRDRVILAAGLALALALVLWLLAGLCFLPHGALAQDAAACDAPGSLRLLPAEAIVDVGRTVTVEVRLEDGGNYYGLDLRLAFDPALLQVPSGRVTPLWDVFDASNHFTIKNEANNISGTVWYAVTNMNPAGAFTGTGRICAIAFTGVASGTAALHFAYAKGSTRGGVGLYPAMLDGQVAVRTPERFVAHVPLVCR